MHDAVWHGHLEAAEALVEAGARLDLRTHAGPTPWGLAQMDRAACSCGFRLR
ncbi:hypothetical protein [Roseomonas harenae]|uniref:hypothetical protein n=1 Tax=Muricoccus harenae TaxID=2692566 RepID=UPI0038B43EA6